MDIATKVGENRCYRPTACPNKILINENSAPLISAYFSPILPLNDRYMCGENLKTRSKQVLAYPVT